MIDITGFDAVTIGAFVGSLVKAFMSDSKAAKAESKAREIEEARIATKIERDKEFQKLTTDVEVLKTKYADAQKRLDDGTKEFKDLAAQAVTTNNLLREIKGALMNKGFVFSDSTVQRRSGHTPENEVI